MAVAPRPATGRAFTHVLRGGPGACPGRDLVVVAGGTALEVLRAPLPATPDHFGPPSAVRRRPPAWAVRPTRRWTARPKPPDLETRRRTGG
ncbi:hypothetical protein [Saccharothrix xinjiangensis]|uniref:Uncharacterized protein n=1 Tax=Saccharothrix xinjiangensis TaxID=204798 RepID=A0ABV9YCV3_9PSEU